MKRVCSCGEERLDYHDYDAIVHDHVVFIGCMVWRCPKCGESWLILDQDGRMRWEPFETSAEFLAFEAVCAEMNKGKQNRQE